MTTIAVGTRLGRYQVRSKLGEGGMGEVYLAQDTGELERTVALKFVTPEIASDPIRMQRFIQEARTVSALNHPNILTIYEFGQADDTRFIATEFIDGTTLREHLSERRVKVHDVLEIAAQIAAALDAAHEAGVVHRDIKPENIMIRRRDHIVKVLDFGLAKPPRKPETDPDSVDSDSPTRVLVHTEPGLIMGTVAYMSPEQSRGAPLDARTDIWSLGIVLFEMVAGRVPFAANDVHRQIIAIQEQEPPPLSKFAEGVPERLHEIVQKALAKEPGERYQTAKDLLIDLRSLRRKLDVDAEIERISAPELRASTSGSEGGAARATAPTGDAASDALRPRASSAEYIGERIKHHRRGIVVGATVLLLAAIAGTWLSIREGSSSSQIESIAVLPFQNMSRNADVEYLSDGMTEALINSLSQLTDLTVKARSSVFRYKGKEVDPQRVASELSVEAIVMGRVLQRGEGVVVYLSLVDARKGNQLWGKQYDRTLTELASLQSEITRDVSEHLRLRLTNPELQQLAKHGTDNAAAYQAYLRGLYYWNKGFFSPGYEKSRGYFQEAIDLDPTYALAYSGLADYYGFAAANGHLPPNQNWPRVEAAIRKAVALNPTLGESYNSMAGVTLYYYRDWPAAERYLRRGIGLAPNYAGLHHHYSTSLMLFGRNDEAITEMRRALALDPLSLRSNLNLAKVLFFARQYDAAIAQCRQTLELDPELAVAHEWLSYAYEQKGMEREAIAESIRALTLGRESEQAAVLERTYAASGFEAAQRALAQRKLQRLKERAGRGDYVPAVQYVTAYMRAGDKDQAFAWLAKAVEERNRFAFEFRVNPLFDSLRSDPRFEVLVARVAVRTEGQPGQ